MNRREFISGMTSLGAMGLGGCKMMDYYGIGDSVYGGIPLGVITFSYWHMPVGYLSALKYVKESGLTSVELMGYDLEVDAGAPVWKLPWDHNSEDKAERDEWRAKVVPEKLFAEVRAKYNDAGVSIHALKPSSSFSGSEKETDEQIEYWFKAAKALGADTLTMEVPNPNNFAAAEKRMKRLAAFCDKYDLNIAFHNHTQINATTYDGPLLGWSKRFFINFDIAHYVAANDDDPLEFVKKYHDRIYSIHIKDRCRKGPRRAKTVPLGEGDTPLKELFALLRKENWLYHCDIEMEHIIPVGSDAVEEVLKCRRYCRSIIAS